MEDNYINRLVKEFGKEKVFHNSVMWYNNGLEDLEKILQENGPFNKILEIGTYRGVTASIFSKYATQVNTVDIVEQPEAELFLDFLGIKNVTRWIEKPEIIKEIIKRFKFDFAFIDGEHFGEHPRNDFKMVKKCGLVLFHDCFEDHHFPDVNEFVESLPKNEVEYIYPYALWRKK